MAEHLTEMSRRAVWLARAEMDELGHQCIGSVQLLVGILLAGGPASASLRSLGVDPEELLDDARSRFRVARSDPAAALPTKLGEPGSEVLVEPSHGCLRLCFPAGVQQLPEGVGSWWNRVLAAGYSRVLIFAGTSLVLDDQAGLELLRGLELLQLHGGGLALICEGDAPPPRTGLFGLIPVCSDEASAVRLLEAVAVPAMARRPEVREQPLVACARRAMATAATVASESGNEFISTGHLLLGLTLVPGLASDMLDEDHGVRPERLRAAVIPA